MNSLRMFFLAPFLAAVLIACSSPMTTRETGATADTVGGAAVGGGIVGSGPNHPEADAGAIGDRLQELEQKQSDLDKRISENETELQRQREELEKLKKESIK